MCIYLKHTHKIGKNRHMKLQNGSELKEDLKQVIDRLEIIIENYESEDLVPLHVGYNLGIIHEKLTQMYKDCDK